MISVVSKTALAAYIDEQLITHFCRGLPTAGIQSNMDDAKIRPIIGLDRVLDCTRGTFSTDSQMVVGHIGLNGLSFGHNDIAYGRFCSGYYPRPRNLAIILHISSLVFKEYINNDFANICLLLDVFNLDTLPSSNPPRHLHLVLLHGPLYDGYWSFRKLFRESAYSSCVPNIRPKIRQNDAALAWVF